MSSPIPGAHTETGELSTCGSRLPTPRARSILYSMLYTPTTKLLQPGDAPRPTEAVLLQVLRAPQCPAARQT